VTQCVILYTHIQCVFAGRSSGTRRIKFDESGKSFDLTRNVYDYKQWRFLRHRNNFHASLWTFGTFTTETNGRKKSKRKDGTATRAVVELAKNVFFVSLKRSSVSPRRILSVNCCTEELTCTQLRENRSKIDTPRYHYDVSVSNHDNARNDSSYKVSRVSDRLPKHKSRLNVWPYVCDRGYII